jgi:uncharacterized repeat protein (TIGR01451 family)/LPXTG-motif cell wall-anchored protein
MVVVVGKSDLAIVKDVLGTPGTSPVFQVVVTNLGPNATTTPLVVTDALPAGLTYVSASGAGWTCNVLAGTVTCTYPAALAVGQATPPIRVATTMSIAPGTSVTNVATATGGQPLCPSCTPVLVHDDATVVAPVPVPVDDEANLSATGTDAAQWSVLAGLLLGAGLLLVVVSRRRVGRANGPGPGKRAVS